jgi:hypothetical protein
MKLSDLLVAKDVSTMDAYIDRAKALAASEATEPECGAFLACWSLVNAQQGPWSPRFKTKVPFQMETYVQWMLAVDTLPRIFHLQNDLSSVPDSVMTAITTVSQALIEVFLEDLNVMHRFDGPQAPTDWRDFAQWTVERVASAKTHMQAENVLFDISPLYMVIQWRARFLLDVQKRNLAHLPYTVFIFPRVVVMMMQANLHYHARFGTYANFRDRMVEHLKVWEETKTILCTCVSGDLATHFQRSLPTTLAFESQCDAIVTWFFYLMWIPMILKACHQANSDGPLVFEETVVPQEVLLRVARFCISWTTDPTISPLLRPTEGTTKSIPELLEYTGDLGRLPPPVVWCILVQSDMLTSRQDGLREMLKQELLSQDHGYLLLSVDYLNRPFTPRPRSPPHAAAASGGARGGGGAPKTAPRRKKGPGIAPRPDQESAGLSERNRHSEEQQAVEVTHEFVDANRQYTGVPLIDVQAFFINESVPVDWIPTQWRDLRLRDGCARDLLALKNNLDRMLPQQPQITADMLREWMREGEERHEFLEALAYHLYAFTRHRCYATLLVTINPVHGNIIRGLGRCAAKVKNHTGYPWLEDRLIDLEVDDKTYRLVIVPQNTMVHRGLCAKAYSMYHHHMEQHVMPLLRRHGFDPAHDGGVGPFLLAHDFTDAHDRDILRHQLRLRIEYYHYNCTSRPQTLYMLDANLYALATLILGILLDSP